MARTPTRAEFLDALGWVPTPDLLAVRVAPDYATAVFNAFKMRKLTRTRAVEMLHGEITPEDLPLEDALDTQDG